LRIVDYRVAQGVDVFIANSEEVQRRIAKFYRRDAIIIHPPVAVPTPSELEFYRRQAKARFGNQFGQYYLYVNRLALAKHPELAVHACTQLKVPLKVVGTGPVAEKLREMAGRSVEFLGAVEDADLHVLYAGAKALVYPVEDEDFGMVPVEAMGHGIPVIAHRSGGPMETILEGKTGWFFDELTSDALQTIIAETETTHLPAAKLARHAEKFGEAQFVKKIKDLVRETAKQLPKPTELMSL
jgi:glycosyltransferase involved in cell wall biosynthesis